VTLEGLLVDGGEKIGFKKKNLEVAYLASHSSFINPCL